MVAVARAMPVGYHRRLALVPPAPAPATKYRRRRVAAAVLVTGVLCALVLSVHTLVGTFGGGVVTVPDRGPAAGAVHVVQPGDTFWDIARSLRPNEDPRPLVARMVAAHGSPVLVVGERIHLPA